MGHMFGIKPRMMDLLDAAVHQWTGWVIFILVVALLASRSLCGAPGLPHGMRSWQRWAAHASHGAIYLGLVALVASGAGAMYLNGRFGLVHIALAKIGTALVAIHVAAALWHQIIRRDGLLARMLPGERGTRRET